MQIYQRPSQKEKSRMYLNSTGIMNVKTLLCICCHLFGNYPEKRLLELSNCVFPKEGWLLSLFFAPSL